MNQSNITKYSIIQNRSLLLLLWSLLPPWISRGVLVDIVDGLVVERVDETN